MSLTNAAAVSAILQTDVSANTYLAELISQADDLINAELGRTAEGGTVTGETHKLDPYAPRLDRHILLLDRWPVASVTTVTEDGTALAAGTGYEVAGDISAGKLRRIDATYGHGRSWALGVPIVVTYETATPPGLSALAAQLVARALKAGLDYATKPSVMAGLRQLTIGRWSATAETGGGAAGATGQALALTDSERATIRAYRDRRP